MSHTFIGTFDRNKAGHEEWYFAERDTYIDFRGPLQISPASYWGFCCRIITLSHILKDGTFFEKTVGKKVQVDECAWICSFALLYNCHICHHGIVSIGSVVNSLVVPPYHVAAGNPAKLTCYWDLEKRRWVYL